MTASRLQFRAWFKEEPEWCDQLFYSSDESAGLGDWFSEVEDAEVIEQSTGLTDRNGKVIYEGDIVGMDGRRPDMLVDIGEWKSWGLTTLAPYDQLGHGVRYRHTPLSEPPHYQPLLLTWVKRCYVAGNIHENPELLAP